MKAGPGERNPKSGTKPHSFTYKNQPRSDGDEVGFAAPAGQRTKIAGIDKGDEDGRVSYGLPGEFWRGRMHLFVERQRAMSGKSAGNSSLFLKLKSAAAISCLLASMASGFAQTAQQPR